MASRIAFSKLSVPVHHRKIEIPTRPNSYYKPIIHRTIAFVVLLLITLCLLALVEYARQIFPHSPWDVPTKSDLKSPDIRRELRTVGIRDATEATGNNSLQISSTVLAPSTTIGTAYLDSAAVTVLPTPTVTTTSQDIFNGPASIEYLDTSIISSIPTASTVSLVAVGVISAYSDTSIFSTTIPSQSIAPTSRYLDTSTLNAVDFTTISAPAASAAPSAYLDSSIFSEVLSSATAASASATAYLDTSINSAIFSTITSSSSSSSTAAIATTSANPTVHPNTSVFSDVSLTVSATPTSTSKATSSFSAAASSSGYLDTSPASSSGYLDTSIISEAIFTSGYLDTQTVPSATTSGYLDTSVVRGAFVTSTSTLSSFPAPTEYSAPPTNKKSPYVTSPTGSSPATETSDISISTTTQMIIAAIVPDPSVISVVQASGQPAPEEIKRPLVLVTNMKYFYGSYLTVLIAVIFRITIGWLYSTTKMLEPFHMLNQEEGVPAKDFFNINYLSANDTFEPFTAMLSGHWQMLAVSLLYATVGFLAPFASEMLHFYRSCEKFENGEIICGAALWINASIARILEGLLICISVLLVVVWGLVRSCASGIYSDPSSIASVCSLLHHPETIVEFQRLDQGASKENIIRNLSGRRFRLDAYQATDGIERYGLISSGNYADDEMDGLYKPIGTVDLHDKPVSKASGTSWRRYSFSWRIVRLAMELLLPITTAGTLILVAYYYKDSSKDGYNRFMNSEGFGPRFLITCVGIIIHTQWTRLERQHSVLEPFRRLHTGHATPESTILISRSLFHVTAFFTSLYRRSYFIALVAFVAVMAEVLIIILPGVPFNSSEIARSFTISSYLSIAILALMLVVLAAIWLRPKGPALPRTPNTLGTLCLYLCDSQMRFELSDMAYMKKGERDYAVRDLEREYVLLSGLGDNGEIRWRVDYDGNDGYGE